VKRTQLMAVLVVPVLGCGAASVAFAQGSTGGGAAPAGGVGGIIVTAQRREQNVQSIPIAVSAFSAADMERRQITETLDLVRVIPNLVGHNNTGPGNSNAYFLRGLGNTESIATFDPPVGTYVDDVYISRQSANNYALFDVERIEVLRGPQGTLFGRNTTAGAINVITKKPGREFAGLVEVGVGEFNRRMVRASVDVPFTDTVLTKFSGFYQENDGFVRSTVTGEKNNGLEGYGGRIAMRLLPSEAVTWDLAAEYAHDSQLNLIRNLTAPDTNITGITQHEGPGSLLDQLRRGEGLGSQTDTVFLVSNFGWQIGDVSLNFITGYRDESWDYIIDFVPNGQRGFSAFAISNLQDTEQFTQEVKAVGKLFGDRLRYTAGLFYIDEQNRTDFQDVSCAPAVPMGPCAFPLVLLDRVVENGTESIAAYLQLDYSVTDRVTLTAGGRYTDEDKDIAFASRNDRGGIFNISTAELIAGGVPVKQGVTKFTPKFSAEFQQTDDWLWYVSATQGFKSGGWNARGAAPHTASSYLPFGPEEIWSYEAGFKSQMLDDRMRLNATAFWADVTDLQLISGVTNPAGGVLFLTQNSGEGRFRGLEAEWQWLPTERLNVSISLGLLDAEFTSIKPQPQSQITTSTQPTRTPDITGNAGFVYTMPALGGEFSLGADVSFTGTHWVSAANSPPVSYVPREWLYQAQLGYRGPGDRWSATLACKNCSDERYITSWFIGPYFGDPRTWDLRVAYRFR